MQHPLCPLRRTWHFLTLHVAFGINPPLCLPSWGTVWTQIPKDRLGKPATVQVMSTPAAPMELDRSRDCLRVWTVVVSLSFSSDCQNNSDSRLLWFALMSVPHQFPLTTSHREDYDEGGATMAWDDVSLVSLLSHRGWLSHQVVCICMHTQHICLWWEMLPW